MLRRIRSFLLAAVVVGCDSTTTTPPPIVRPSGTSSSPTPTSTARILPVGDTTGAFVGRRFLFQIEARDQSGNLVNTDNATIVVSNESVATVADVTSFTLQSGTTSVREMQFALVLAGVGTTTVQVQVGEAKNSMGLNVVALPPVSTALVVDSFSVAEVHVTCAWNCPYLEYVPLLYLREPTGKAYVDAIAMEITIPTMTTGVCSGDVHFGPGTSRLASYTYDYLWSNDVFFVSLDGKPVPGGEATARVILRDASGKLSRIEATGPIIRSAPDPTIPTPATAIEEWLCLNG